MVKAGETARNCGAELGSKGMPGPAGTADTVRAPRFGHSRVDNQMAH